MKRSHRLIRRAATLAVLLSGAITAGATGPAAPAAARPPEFSETEVWGKDPAYAAHFVYGITVTDQDTVLVACEGRVAGPDAGEKDLLVKRSTDHGATWSADTVIEGRSDRNSWSNPTFVTAGATTYLFYSWSVSSDIGRVFYRTTRDDGLTWSARIEITGLWADNGHGWTQHSSIGHGIVKTRPPDAGRIFLAFAHRGRVAVPPKQRHYGNDVICLGPHGWEIAGGPPVDPARGTNEAELAEGDDGSLFLIARQASGDNQIRARSESRDGGRTWTDWTSVPTLRGTTCDGGLLHFGPGLDFYTFPGSTARSAQQRRNLTIKYSDDGGVTWKGGRLIHRGQSTYSDLARDSAGNVYCLYGRGGTNFMGDRVYVARFTAAWATGTDRQPGPSRPR
ncbi:MAG TPA: sialidase family protein [Opitutaceae bacterium]|nr:sialidase family protein [Opitutaceae bacterium]